MFLKYSKVYNMVDFFNKFRPDFYNFLPLFIKNIVFIVLSFFQLYIMTNYLDIESYGKLQFVLTIVASIVFLTLPGSNLAYNKMGAKNDEKYFFSLLKYKIKFSLIGSFAILGISLFYWNDKSLFFSLVISSFAFPFFYNLDSYLSLLNGQEKFHKKVKYEILKQITTVSLLTITVLFFSKDIVILLFVIFSSSIMFNILVNLSLFKKNKVYLKISKLSDYKKYTKDMSWVSVIGVIESRLDRIIIGTFFGFTNLAIFHVAKAMQEQFKNLWVVFANLIIPKTYNKNKIENKIYLLKALGYSIAIFFIITILAIMILPWVFSLLFHQQYSNSLDYLNIMLFNVVIGIPNAVLIIYFNTHSLLKTILAIKISSLVVYVICLIIFSYYWQIWGIIYANIFRVFYASLVTTVLFLMEKRDSGNEHIISI
jgi:O-antigen/teichoic acid export membrane protein